MKKTVLLALALMTAPISAQAAEGIEVFPVKDNLYMLKNPHGGNITVSTGAAGNFIIDDNLKGRDTAIMETISGIKGAGEQIKFILNTHYHFDHTGTNVEFGNKGAVIVAHDNVRERLSTDQFITHFNKELPAMDKAGLPVVTFSQDLTFHYNDDTISVHHAPHAHTDGDAVAYFKEDNVIVAGDLIFNGMYPFIDVEHGGSIKGVIKGLDEMIEMVDDQTVIVPGHGDLMSKGQLVAYRDMLVEIMARVKALIGEAKTTEDIIAADPVGKYAENLTKGPVSKDDFIKLAVESLKK